MGANIYAGKSAEETFDALLPLDALTSAQKLKWLNMETGLQKDLGANVGATGTKTRTVFLGAFSSFYNNASTNVLAMKKNGRSKADCLKQVDVMLDSYLTKARIDKILNDYKSSLTSQEWQSVRTRRAELVHWSMYGL